MLDIDIRPAGQGAAVVVMTYGTALLRGLRGIDRGIVGHIMTMSYGCRSSRWQVSQSPPTLRFSAGT